MTFYNPVAARQAVSRPIITGGVTFILAIILLAGDVRAQSLRAVVGDVVRGTARVADDIPVKKVDDLIADLNKSRAAREAVDTELRQAGRAGRGATRSNEVRRMLRSVTGNLDPKVIQRIERLDDASLDVALVLAKGGDELARTVPDLAMRGRLVREGGPETVAAVGMFGSDAARAAVRLDEAIKGGSVVVKHGGRAVTVADFGRVMTQYGNASWHFWEKYIRPHWKKWAAGGALVAYLANPEYFQDAAGNLTQAGFKHLAEFVGTVAAAAIRGTGEGAGNAAKKVAEATVETFFSSPDGVYALIGVGVIAAFLLLFFRRVRSWVLWPFRWLSQVPRSSHASNSSIQEEGV